jgi:hypothetical protein
MRKRRIVGIPVVVLALTVAGSAVATTPKAGVLDDVLAVLSSGQFDISDIQNRFCTTLMPMPSSEGFAGSVQSTSIGCGLPIDYMRVDPVRPGAAGAWMNLWFKRGSCVPGDVLESYFPGGERTMATDTGATVYIVKAGKGAISAMYETATSRYGCVSQLSLSIQ